MSDYENIQDWVADANSLLEFVKRVEANGNHIDIEESNLSELLWNRDVPRKRALKILQEERGRLDEYENINVSESSRAPRYVDLNDLELVSGYEFEYILAEILRRIDGDATVTEASGDQGVDVIWIRENSTVVFRLRRMINLIQLGIVLFKRFIPASPFENQNILSTQQQW